MNQALCSESRMEIIDLETWERTEHFNFFQSLQKCNYGTTVQVDVSTLYDFRKEANNNGGKLRFSDLVYFFAMKAVNAIPELRTRIVDGNPVIFDVVHPAFTYIPKGRSLHANVVCRYAENYAEQSKYFEIARNNSDIAPTLSPEGGNKQNLIYFSIVTGVPFSAASNPWGDCSCDSVPRILFGQMHETESGRKMLPVSIELLHSLADGRHLAEFYRVFTELCSNPQNEIQQQ
ncbi:CatA-like O-acetyltransferase [Maridesulfovibrio sp. FT414]|uniref:CatA-like O-acetyltransferase n=1 Tax=Maridesulfovibrio sp. FT414 TaxID=2979469 RepID=UPI003D808E1F